MSEIKQELGQATDNLLKNKSRMFDTIVISTTLTLALIGIAVTDYSPLNSYRYWTAMAIILSVVGIYLGVSRARALQLPLGKAFIVQTLHWSATLLTIVAVYLTLKTGRMNYETTGLILLYILGLSTFLDGCRVNWKFSLIGVLIFVTGIIATYIEAYLWVLIGLVIAVIIVLYLRLKRQKYHSVENEIDD